ncbi:CAP Gly-rich domain-containing protein [Syncephalis plumigaleata]|nr:CAP Gly-rich domain-containing protein [Syncephalis plumigaleata]
MAHFAQDTWIGVELESTVGRNDGSVNGIRYFTAEANRGLFVRSTNIQIVGAQS